MNLLNHNNLNNKLSFLTKIFSIFLIFNILTVDNTGMEVEHLIPVSHQKSRISEIKIYNLNSQVESSNIYDFFYLEVDNNTIDGYEITISSQNGGIFQPETIDHGETGVSYKINVIEQYGKLGSNMTVSDCILPTIQNEPYEIIKPIDNTFQSTATKDLRLLIQIEFNNSDYESSLAGNLSDVFTIKYIDL